MTIRELREAVEAGAANMNDFAAVFPSETAYGPTTWGEAHKAYNGSLDAAKRLHDALLPGWRVVDISELNSHGFKGKWLAELASWTEEKSVRVLADSEARARLIAILRALEQEGRDG